MTNLHGSSIKLAGIPQYSEKLKLELLMQVGHLDLGVFQ